MDTGTIAPMSSQVEEIDGVTSPPTLPFNPIAHTQPLDTPAPLTGPSNSALHQSQTPSADASVPTAFTSSSSPLPSITDQPRLSLSESLAQLQGEAAFVSRPPPPAVGTLDAMTTVEATSSVPEEKGNEPFIEGLTARELFTRLPESDAVSVLLEKYLSPEQRPSRDLSGNWQGQTLEGLIADRNWRGTARYAYNAITQAPPEQTAYILAHWLLRLHSLLRMRLVSQLASEVAALHALLPPSSCFATTSSDLPPATPRFHPAVPFDLHVLAASLPGLQGHPRRALESLSSLLKASKEELWIARRLGSMDAEIWRPRAEHVGEMLTELLKEIKAPASAATLLGAATPSPSLHLALSRLHFSTGNLMGLAKHASAVDGQRNNQGAAVLELVAQGSWGKAEADLRKLVREEPQDVEASNNLAVVMLYTGKLDEAITLITSLLSSHPSLAYNDETILFNLATLHELRSEQAGVHKVQILRSAAEFGAQGVEAGAFKLAL